MEYVPIFYPGFHEVSFGDLREVLLESLVTPFGNSLRRELLLNRLLVLFTAVSNVHIFTEAWIDGSFVAEKEEPDDIDIVLWYDTAPAISPRELRIYRELHDNGLMMSRYRCDVYLAANGNDKLRRYWENWFGHDRTGHPKGIIRVVF